MNFVVCIKQTIGPEIPPEQFRLDPVAKRQVRGSLSLVIGSYDQNALEVALQVKVAHLGVVGDFKVILPAFLRKCKELVQG